MKRHGFTLVELLVVIGITAVLISVLLPTMSQARRSAQRVKASSDVRQMLAAYIQYSIDNKGSLLLGYPPATVNGVPVVAELPDGRIAGAPTSQRYPWRLIRYVSNVWSILYGESVPEDEYVKGLLPRYALNSVFLGGHNSGYFAGYVGDRPNTGKHVLFKSSEIRHASQQIVFIEVTQSISASDGQNGAFFALPPRGNAPSADHRWWSVSGDGQRAVPLTSTFGGLPNGRLGKGTVVGFFDGHVALLIPRELDDMRLWSTRFSSFDSDFTP